jgi:Ser/Thr protein kinase RdoA (MazF antagonist)
MPARRGRSGAPVVIERDRLRAVLGPLLGAPVEVELLKDKPGRRSTMRASGSGRSAIVKVYESERAATVAARVRGLAGGLREPVVPQVLLLDEALHLVVLSEVPGVPLTRSLTSGDRQTCARAGAALGAWHAAGCGTAPGAHRPHTVARELAILDARLEHTPDELAAAVRAALPALADGDWGWPTIIHRDLYEEQIMVGERIGLIDLDDSALGPPELDLGNLLGHLLLLERRSGVDMASVTNAFLDAYRASGPVLDEALLERCRALTLLRLACIHREAALVDDAAIHAR